MSSAIHAGRLELLISRVGFQVLSPTGGNGERDGRSGARCAPWRSSLHGRGRARRLRDRRRRRPRRETLARSPAESRHRPEVHGAPRRRLRRAAGDGAGITTTIPQSVPQGRGEAAQAPTARATSSPKTPSPSASSSSSTWTRARPMKPARSCATTLTGGPRSFARLPPGADQRGCPSRPRPGGPALARSSKCCCRVKGDAAEAERWLYLRRLELRERFQAAGLERLYPSLSASSSATRGCSPARSSPTSTPT